MEKNWFLSSLFGGGMAGLVVDIALFPLDTFKTRLQCTQGFQKSGGFNGVYRGIGPQVIGSVPQVIGIKRDGEPYGHNEIIRYRGKWTPLLPKILFSLIWGIETALFFCTYESFKHYLTPHVSSQALPIVHMAGGSMAEVVACLVRVPMEVVKQRKQTCIGAQTSWSIAIDAYKSDGFFKGLYRGFGSTVIREVPFSFIQLPILEYLKVIYSRKLRNSNPLNSLEVANCGAVAGGISAAITTPLDVVKTRIMLAKSNDSGKSLKYFSVWNSVYREKGVKGLFAGFVPRVVWITLGGYIFFGTYDFAKTFCYVYLFNDIK